MSAISCLPHGFTINNMCVEMHFASVRFIYLGLGYYEDPAFRVPPTLMAIPQRPFAYGLLYTITNLWRHGMYTCKDIRPLDRED